MSIKGISIKQPDGSVRDIDIDHGGPAFPVASYVIDGTAYDDSELRGMNLRDYFAVRATKEDIENHRTYEIRPDLVQHTHYTVTVEQAKYAYADAMINARNSA